MTYQHLTEDELVVLRAASNMLALNNVQKGKVRLVGQRREITTRNGVCIVARYDGADFLIEGASKEESDE